MITNLSKSLKTRIVTLLDWLLSGLLNIFLFCFFYNKWTAGGVVSSCSFCFHTHGNFSCLLYVSCTERERSDQLPKKYPWLARLAPHHCFGPGRITVKTGDNFPCEFPIDMFVCELLCADYKSAMKLSTRNPGNPYFPSPPDHCSSWNSRHIRAEVSHCWRCLRFYETTVIGVGGMGQIYSCLWRAATGWPGNRAAMHTAILLPI